MIDSAAGFVAAVLALAGLFPVLATRWPQPFSVVPPIVWSYVATTLLALGGAWSQTPSIQGVQQETSARLMPALVFLLMVGCDLRAILGLGPRALGAFGCASGSILVGLAVAWCAWRTWLPADGWQALGCLGGSWVGGTANLVATGQGIDAAPAMVAAALLVDTICYAAWVTLLFATVPLAGRFDRWVHARPWDGATAGARGPEASATPGHVLCWLAASLAVGITARQIADAVPPGGPLTPGTWTLLFASAAGLIVAVTPLARLPGAAGLGSGLLAVAVVTLAAQGDVRGLDRVAWLVAAGFTALAVHALLMLAAARLWGFDLALCGIASLASVGGIASAPLLAAAHRQQLVPVAVLLALVGYLLGTWSGIGLATALSRFPGVTP